MRFKATVKEGDIGQPPWVNLEPMDEAPKIDGKSVDLSFTLSNLPTDPEAQYAQAKRVANWLDQHLEEVWVHAYVPGSSLH